MCALNYVIMMNKLGDAKKMEEDSWLRRIQYRYNNITSCTPEILQILVKKNDETNRSDKKIQEFSQRLEKENIIDNIYYMIKIDIVWKTLVQALLTHWDKTKILQKKKLKN